MWSVETPSSSPSLAPLSAGSVSRHVGKGDEMRLPLRAGTVCALLTSAVLFAASAASAAGLDGPAKARAAGIAVDPGAERLMQEAPAGSCFNDPTRATCPPASRVAATSPSVAQGDGSTGYAFAAPAPGAALANAAAAGVPQCFVKSDPPFFAAGTGGGLRFASTRLVRSQSDRLRDVHLPVLTTHARDPRTMDRASRSGAHRDRFAHRPAVRRRPARQRLFVLGDVTAGTRLGPVELVSRFAIEVKGQTGIVLAGIDEHAVTVTVEWDEGADRRSVHGGAWMTLPRLLTPGEHVRVTWDHQDGEQRFTTLGPLYADELIPNRPSWTPYANR